MQYHSGAQSPQESNRLSSPAETARARSRLYSLLGDLLQSGLTPELLSVVAVIDEFAKVLPTEFNAHEAAAAHQQIFGFAIFAHESFFVDPSGMLGGHAAEIVMNCYVELGFSPDNSVADGDQLGTELKLLAFLCGAEADAWEDGIEEQAIRMQAAQARFMQDHLLRWIAPVLWAIQQEADPFYSAVADVVWALVSDHYEAIPKLPTHPSLLPNTPDLLTNPDTNLRDIAEFLMTPCYSGLFISRTMVGELGRVLQLPRGFSDRTTMLVNLMQSAAQYDGSLVLLEQLIAKFENAMTFYDVLMEGNEESAHAINPWRERCMAAIKLLKEMLLTTRQEIEHR